MNLLKFPPLTIKFGIICAMIGVIQLMGCASDATDNSKNTNTLSPKSDTSIALQRDTLADRKADSLRVAAELARLDSVAKAQDSTILEKQPRPKKMPPKAQFSAVEYDYGIINQGDIVEYIFKFSNVGEKPLEVFSAKGSCGCTAAGYSFLPILPGEKSKIQARFDSKGKIGNQRTTVTVTTNGDPKVYTLILKGQVVEKSPKDSIN